MKRCTPYVFISAVVLVLLAMILAPLSLIFSLPVVLMVGGGSLAAFAMIGSAAWHLMDHEC